MTGARSTLVSMTVMTLLLGAAVLLLRPELAAPGREVPARSEDDVVAWLDAAVFDQALRTATGRVGGFPDYYAEVEGGMPLGAHPTDGTASPLTWLLRRASALSAVKWKTFLSLWAGTLGAFLLGRRFGAGRPASFAAALLVPASGFVNQILWTRPLDMGALWALPAIAILMHAPPNALPVLLVAAFAVMSAFQTGSLFVGFFLVGLFAMLVRALFSPTERTQGCTLAVQSLSLALLVGAIRWIPAVDVLGRRDWNRAVRLADLSHTPWMSRLTECVSLVVPGSLLWLAIPIFTLALYGVTRAKAPRAGVLMAVLVILWALLPEAPAQSGLFRTLWSAIRPLAQPLSIAPIYVTFFVAGLCAVALDRIMRNRPTARATVVPLLFVVGVALPDTASLRSTRPVPTLQAERLIAPDANDPAYFTVRTRHFLVPEDRPADLHPTLFLETGLGVSNAVRTYNGARRAVTRLDIPVRRLRPRINHSYNGEAWLQYRRGKVESVTENPDALRVVLSAENDNGTLIVNRNFDNDWFTIPAMPTFAQRGLLAARMEKAGRYDIDFRYRASAWKYGLGLSIAGLLFAAIAVVIEAIGRRESPTP